MKKIILGLFILFSFVLFSCDSSSPHYEYHQFTFDVESDNKFALKNTPNDIVINLQEFTSIQPAQYQFKFLLDNPNKIVKDNQGNTLTNNTFYPITSGITNLKYINSNAELNGITIVMQNISSYHANLSESEAEQTKKIALNNIESGFNFQAYNYNWDEQHNANIFIHVKPDPLKSLDDYSLSVIIKKAENTISEPYIWFGNKKYYNGDRLPLNNEVLAVWANNFSPKDLQVEYIQFQLETVNNKEVLLSDKLSLIKP